MNKRKVKRADFDWLLGREDYQPGFADAIAWALFALCFMLAMH